MADVIVLGSGLIGTSIGLAARQAGWDVALSDERPTAVKEAVGRGAGRAWDGRERAATVVVAVPPRNTAPALLNVQRMHVATTYTHVASVQSQVQREIESLSPDPSRVVGGHPLAGRERSGPSAAAADLFVGRTWALCPTDATSVGALSEVRALVGAMGADPVVLSAADHDAAVALLSHLPQLAASALAACLADDGSLLGSGDRLRLAGPGVVDTTRLAASDPGLWLQILELNAAEIAPAVLRLAQRLSAAATALAALAGATPDDPSADRALADLQELLQAGNAGRALVPVKRGARDAAFAPVRVTVPDEPGRLAALLGDAGAAGINVEDVHVDHVPGRPTGVIELLTATQDAPRLTDALRSRGWVVAERDDF